MLYMIPFIQLLKNKHKHPYLPMLNDLRRLWVSKKVDVMLRDAPHILITTSHQKNQ